MAWGRLAQDRLRDLAAQRLRRQAEFAARRLGLDRQTGERRLQRCFSGVARLTQTLVTFAHRDTPVRFALPVDLLPRRLKRRLVLARLAFGGCGELARSRQRA